MIKYIKWISLLFLIITIFILVIKFVNYNNSVKYKDNNNDNNNKFIISDIYGFELHKFGIAIYNGNELFSENYNLNGPYNMTFNEDKVTYCNSVTNECDDYSYLYIDGKLTIDSGDYFLAKGTYDVKLKDDILEFSTLNDELTMVVYFNYPLG